MNCPNHIQNYLNTINTPWGKLFYLLIWHPLESVTGKNVLDFGSGFGITSNFLAKTNRVTAIEPNEEMIRNSICTNPYRQITGGIEQMKRLSPQTYDVILCHNVFEYVDDKKKYLKEFQCLLKPDGLLSIVKHNKAGKIMQKAVAEYQIQEAIQLLNGKNSESEAFGSIKEYDNQELENDSDQAFSIKKTYGIRTFYALQRNEWKNDDNWIQQMYQLECRVEKIPEFRSIAFFHHLLCKKS